MIDSPDLSLTLGLGCSRWCSCSFLQPVNSLTLTRTLTLLREGCGTPCWLWSSLWDLEDWTSASPEVQEDGQIDLLIKTLLLDIFPLRFWLLSGSGENPD